MERTLADLIAVEEIAPNEYVSKHLPANMGVALPIAYGGCALGVAIHAASLTVPSNFHLYSVLGHYHGPASLTEKLYITVERTRDTRSFATRRIRITQRTPKKARVCMDMMADFHAREQQSLAYSAPLPGSYPPAEDLPTVGQVVDEIRNKGRVLSDKDLIIHEGRTAPLGALFDIRLCPGSLSRETLYGLLNPCPTSQDHLPVGSRRSAEWVRMRERLSSDAEHVAALAFGLDGGISTLPLLHNQEIRLDQVVASASLDFALRLMQPTVDMNKWHLQERITSSSAGGITYGEAKLWNDQGILVASMSQQCILRLKKDDAKL
ncbi:thioesterase-like superfamily-domain-containing protein [Xylariales sp. PMI_506]|nr:thioesterase-like superfamily-domain-containing protein [Xylariales sp. PMI_506]